jgi:hypothetical protein
LDSSADTFLPLTPAATKAKYWITFFVFSVLPAPDSPLIYNNKLINYYIFFIII